MFPREFLPVERATYWADKMCAGEGEFAPGDTFRNSSALRGDGFVQLGEEMIVSVLRRLEEDTTENTSFY